MNLVKHNDKKLITQSIDVQLNEFGQVLDDFMSRMSDLMLKKSGVGIAANQVGENKRFFVMVDDYNQALVKVVNPIIVYETESLGQEQISLSGEGCLSYPGLSSTISRRMNTTLLYKTPFGEQKILKASGFTSFIIQHEIDHLDGITLLTRLPAFKRSKFLKTMS